MRPSEQEQRCASAVCRYLEKQTGQRWQLDKWLDQGRDAEPSPDVLLTGGDDAIALEITQLTAGKRFENHDNAQRSLHRKLAPDTVRNFELTPPAPLELPLDPKLIRLLKRSIADAVKDLPVGKFANVLIPQQATVKHLGTHAIDSTFCLHEEWHIYRGKDSTKGQGGVSVVGAVVDYQDVAAYQGISKAIKHAKDKFRTRAWGNRTAVALDAGEQRGHLLLESFERILNRLEADDVAPVDMVLMINGDEVRQCRDFGKAP